MSTKKVQSLAIVGHNVSAALVATQVVSSGLEVSLFPLEDEGPFDGHQLLVIDEKILSEISWPDLKNTTRALNIHVHLKGHRYELQNFLKQMAPRQAVLNRFLDLVLGMHLKTSLWKNGIRSSSQLVNTPNTSWHSRAPALCSFTPALVPKLSLMELLLSEAASRGVKLVKRNEAVHDIQASKIFGGAVSLHRIAPNVPLQMQTVILCDSSHYGHKVGEWIVKGAWVDRKLVSHLPALSFVIHDPQFLESGLLSTGSLSRVLVNRRPAEKSAWLQLESLHLYENEGRECKVGVLKELRLPALELQRLQNQENVILSGEENFFLYQKERGVWLFESAGIPDSTRLQGLKKFQKHQKSPGVSVST